MIAVRAPFAAFLACVAITAAHAETRQVQGSQLVLNSTLSQDTDISTDPSLSGEIRVSMDGSLACLTIAGGATAVISTGGCSEDEGKLHIDISPDTALTLNATGSGDIHMADLRAPLVASLAGSGDLYAGRAGGLVLNVHGSNNVTAGEIAGPTTIDITGSGDVKLHAVRGNLTTRQAGSGDLVIGRINADAANMEGSGSGDALLGAGRIEALHAAFHGSSDLAVAAEVQNADVAASGGSDIKLGRVSGRLNKQASGDSDIIVGGNGLVNLLIGQAAEKIGDIDRDGTITVHHSSGPGLFHFLTVGFVILVVFISYRIIRRGGGLPRFGAALPAAPTNPGVLAVCDRLTQLDQRLSRLESYVTTREFDLNRKFRELGK